MSDFIENLIVSNLGAGPSLSPRLLSRFESAVPGSRTELLLDAAAAPASDPGEAPGPRVSTATASGIEGSWTRTAASPVIGSEPSESGISGIVNSQPRSEPDPTDRWRGDPGIQPVSDDTIPAVRGQMHRAIRETDGRDESDWWRRRVEEIAGQLDALRGAAAGASDRQKSYGDEAPQIFANPFAVADRTSPRSLDSLDGSGTQSLAPEVRTAESQLSRNSAPANPDRWRESQESERESHRDAAPATLQPLAPQPSRTHPRIDPESFRPEIIQADSKSPTINVTIGRVDVRAVRQEAAAGPGKREQSAPPVMSLAEYLHRRSSGGLR